MGYYALAVDQSCIVQGRVAFCVLYVNEGLAKFRQGFHKVKVGQLAAEVESGLSRLGARVKLGQLFNQNVDNI